MFGYFRIEMYCTIALLKPKKIVFFNIITLRMNRIIFLFCLVLVTSCHYFEKEKINSEDLIEEELKTISWTDVDDYPSFTACDSLSDKSERKLCFQNTLIDHVRNYLSEQTIIVSKEVNDTIKINLEVSNQGVISINKLDINPETRSQINNIDSLIWKSIRSLPKIYPAIKRGQEVSTRFELPLIVSIN